MLDFHVFPEITTAFEGDGKHSANQKYLQIIRDILSNLIPKKLYTGVREREHSKEIRDEIRDRLHAHLPFLTSSAFSEVPTNISFFLVTKYRTNSFKFFFEMLCNWLVPGKCLNAILLYAADFKIPSLGEDLYTLCEVMFCVESREELEAIRQNLPVIKFEIRLGIGSASDAGRILETKGLSVDAKTALIQEHIVSLMHRLPSHFEQDLFTEMPRLLISCSDQFKEKRSYRHLSRLIATHYLFRRALHKAVTAAPEKRHLSLKIFRVELFEEVKKRSCLGIALGINFLKENEAFEEKHVVKAVQNYIPEAHVVKDSFFSNRRGSDTICTLYLEITKNDARDFSEEEIRLLRKELPSDLKDCIEHLVPPVFMPRNEEEVMRNILVLSDQLKYVNDLPQVVMTFEEQTDSELFFTLILVRIKREKDRSIQEMFASAKTFLDYLQERCKIMGYLRKKYAKEATVFRVKLPKEMFLRGDWAINLYKARQVVIAELSRIIGDFRDYNGGMISKQNELLCTVRKLLEKEKMHNDFLLENFFYSLTPAMARTVVEPEILKTLFLSMIHAVDKGFVNEEPYHLIIEQKKDVVCAVVLIGESGVREKIDQAFKVLNLHANELITAFINVSDIPCLGYLYCTEDPIKREKFCLLLRHSIDGLSFAKKQAVEIR